MNIHGLIVAPRDTRFQTSAALRAGAPPSGQQVAPPGGGGRGSPCSGLSPAGGRPAGRRRPGATSPAPALPPSQTGAGRPSPRGTPPFSETHADTHHASENYTDHDSLILFEVLK